MNHARSRPTTPAPNRIRCAIYTRKSTEEGLQQEFNSLDAQREAAEAYVLSQQHEGWICLPDNYDDGGYSGGSLDRPAVQRLMADIEAGKIDCVVVYKVDRLSRSLLDFARLMETFEKNKVAFVSVTQQFNTTNSMGRLMLNVLLSFAQFEREIIGERTRDKLAATRRKGKWAGGMPVLGYDVKDTKLVVNTAEVERVRAIFELYIKHEAVTPVLKDLQRRGWTTKRWTTQRGSVRGGSPFNKSTLYKLLTNVAYVGRVRHKTATYPGEHPGIVDLTVWQKVQTLLQRNARCGGSCVRNSSGAVLQGLLKCRACGCAMTPAHTQRGSKRYSYYVCGTAQKRGWDACPTKSISAGAIETVVLNQIRRIGTNPILVRDTVAQAHAQADERLLALAAEQRDHQRDLVRWCVEVKSIAKHGPADGRPVPKIKACPKWTDDNRVEAQNA